jgi:hypothetical protein
MWRMAGVFLAFASMTAFDLRAAEVNKASALSRGANAGLAASAGVSIKTSSEAGQSLALDPSASYARQWLDGAFEISTDASLDYLLDEGRLGDSTANLISSYQSQIGTDVWLNFDASYEFDHEIEQSAVGGELASTDHTMGGFAGLEWQVGGLGFVFDVGAVSVLHGAARRDDGLRFSRDAQDYVEPEAALRVNYGPEDEWQPFVEVAYVGRRYFSDRSLAGVRRHMHGPELIVGLQTEQATVEGQIAAIITHRDYAEPGIASSTVAGPYVDVTFKPGAKTAITFAAAAQIDQETTGPVRGNPFYSSTLDVAYQLRDDMTLAASTIFEFEDDPGQGGTVTLSPELSYTWQFRPGVAFKAVAAADWEDSQGMKSDLAATLQAGLIFQLRK